MVRAATATAASTESCCVTSMLTASATKSPRAATRRHAAAAADAAPRSMSAMTMLRAPYRAKANAEASPIPLAVAQCSR